MKFCDVYLRAWNPYVLDIEDSGWVLDRAKRCGARVEVERCYSVQNRVVLRLPTRPVGKTVGLTARKIGVENLGARLTARPWIEFGEVVVSLPQEAGGYDETRFE
jgi:hypothetical protein